MLYAIYGSVFAVLFIVVDKIAPSKGPQTSTFVKRRFPNIYHYLMDKATRDR